MEKVGLIGILVFVFLAELPCIFRTTALQMYSGNLYNVIVGTMVGNAIALVVGLALAYLLVRFFHLQHFEFMNYLSGSVFILLGLYIMLSGHDH